MIDLAGRPLTGVKLDRRNDGFRRVDIAPFQIVTFEVRWPLALA
jgi:hypothetical protein